MMSGGTSQRLRSWLALFSIVLASCGSTGEPSASGVIGEGETVPSGDSGGECVLGGLLSAGYIAGILSPRGLTVDRSVEPWPHLVVDLVGGVDVEFDLAPKVVKENLVRILLWPGVGDQLETLFDATGERDVHLVGQGFRQDSLPNGSVLLEFIEDEVHAYDSCREEWHDITAKTSPPRGPTSTPTSPKKRSPD